MKRSEMLDKAKETVCGHREQDYGTPEDNFGVIADLWSIYLASRMVDRLTARDVAHMMCFFKLGRLTTGTGTEDCYIDLAGYAACAAEIMENE